MKRKAIKELAKLSDEELFAELEVGIKLCLANANRIEGDAQLLASSNRERGAKILRLSADEEAAKVLILLDAVRCPRKQKELTDHLDNFERHLAKGIYARYSVNGCATFGQLRNAIEVEKKQFYLDGPNDTDWIWYNEILRRREEAIYVDYYENDGERKWHDPQFGEGWSQLCYFPSAALRLANAMQNAGWLVAPALVEVARIWRSVKMEDSFPWAEIRKLNCMTVEAIEAKGLLIGKPNDEYARIVNEWTFPLWGLPIAQCDEVKQADLRNIQHKFQAE